MNSTNFKKLTGMSIKEWAIYTHRPYSSVRKDFSRGYCMLVKKTKHTSQHRLHRTWTSMKSRCYDPKSTSYPNYGQQGIRICHEWFYSFDKFVEDMYPSFKEGLTLDRINNKGDYSKNNCRWASRLSQALNRKQVTCPGVRKRSDRNRWTFFVKLSTGKIHSKDFHNRNQAVEYAISYYKKHNMIEYFNKATEVYLNE